MRTDFQDSFGERTRRRSYDGYNSFQSNRLQSRLDPEGAFAPTSMRKLHKSHYCGKESTYGPGRELTKFLQSRIGQLWNDVYSDMIATVTSAYARHKLKEALLWKVKTKSTFENDSVIVLSDEGPCHEDNLWDGTFYVHPVTKQLCQKRGRPAYWRTPASKKEVTRIEGANPDYVQYYLIKGIWYEVALRPATPHEQYRCCFYNPGYIRADSENSASGLRKVEYQQVWTNRILEQLHSEENVYGDRIIDVFGRSQLDLYQAAVRLFGRPVLPIAKRQLSKAEIKRLVKPHL